MEENTISSIVISDPGKALRPLHKQTKLTRKKKLQFIEELGKEFNVSKAAAAVGVHRKAIQYLINNDEQFREAFEEIKNGWLDKSEGSGFVVAIQPTREGYNDRKLMLAAHRPEKYANKPETAIQVNISTEHGQISLNNLLDKPSNHPQDAEFTMLSSKKNKR